MKSVAYTFNHTSLLALLLALTTVSAFSPASRPVLTPGRLIQGQTIHALVLKAEEKKETEKATERPVVADDGTYFDDEVSRRED